MVGQYRGGEEKEWKVESLHRFHVFEPSMPKGPVSYVEDRSICGCHIWTPEDEFPGHHQIAMATFQGYHQIALAAEDREKIALISPNANYHYTMIPFGLKDAGATYQRMMTKMFRDKIGHTVEVYIDDIVVKSKQEAWHIEDLQGVFEVLRQHKLRLNADKCAFGVRACKFLGYQITNRGIEVNPDQIEAMKRLKLSSNPKEVQVLTGMLTALNRLISKFADR